MTVATDLHIHSCLSPCGDDRMIPSDLVGMSLLSGQQLIALTDHNTARNCPAAANAAAVYGIGFIPGAEVTTSEDIHAVCLFPDLVSALDFDKMLYPLIPNIPNRPQIFGEQVIYSSDGVPCGVEPKLLIAACGISIIDLPEIVAGYGGICYPAHIDREGNGLLSILGAWPEELDVRAAEISGKDAEGNGELRIENGESSHSRYMVGDGLNAALKQKLPDGLLETIKIIRASDAHYLHDLPQQGFPIEMESPDFSGLVRWLG